VYVGGNEGLRPLLTLFWLSLSRKTCEQELLVPVLRLVAESRRAGRSVVEKAANQMRLTGQIQIVKADLRNVIHKIVASFKQYLAS
jgi:hypothetical protein